MSPVSSFAIDVVCLAVVSVRTSFAVRCVSGIFVGRPAPDAASVGAVDSIVVGAAAAAVDSATNRIPDGHKAAGEGRVVMAVIPSSTISLIRRNVYIGKILGIAITGITDRTASSYGRALTPPAPSAILSTWSGSYLDLHGRIMQIQAVTTETITGACGAVGQVLLNQLPPIPFMIDQNATTMHTHHNYALRISIAVLQ